MAHENTGDSQTPDPAAGDAAGSGAGAEPAAAGAEPAAVDQRPFEKCLKDLEGASRDLKTRIDDERRRHDMPIDSALGDPAIEAENADGRNDLPDRDED